MSTTMILISNKEITKTKYELKHHFDDKGFGYDFYLKPLCRDEEFILSNINLGEYMYSLGTSLLFLDEYKNSTDTSYENEFIYHFFEWLTNQFFPKLLQKGHQLQLLRFIMSNYPKDILPKNIAVQQINLNKVTFSTWKMQNNTIYNLVQNQ